MACLQHQSILVVLQAFTEGLDVDAVEADAGGEMLPAEMKIWPEAGVLDPGAHLLWLCVQRASQVQSWQHSPPHPPTHQDASKDTNKHILKRPQLLPIPCPCHALPSAFVSCALTLHSFVLTSYTYVLTSCTLRTCALKSHAPVLRHALLPCSFCLHPCTLNLHFSRLPCWQGSPVRGSSPGQAFLLAPCQRAPPNP